MPPLATCTQCGTDLEAGADSCLECGTPIGLMAVATPPGHRPPPEPGDPADAFVPSGPDRTGDDPLRATVLTPGGPDVPDPFKTGPGAGHTPDLLASLQQVTMGRYLIESELGRGGMATVFLAHERLANRKVAIKVMSPALLHGADTVERFRLEATTTASLNHPGIVPIYLVEESGGLLFFIMKYVDGPSLEAHIAHSGPLPFDTVERVIRGVGEALDYAHSEGVIHRDIKPGNLMLDGRGRPVITDFGIAKVAAQQTLTLTGKTIGTPTYMSPEQCRGGSIAGASDQYSFGIVLYEMLAGQVPFRADSHWALLYKHLNDPPPHIHAVRPDCPQRLWDIVDRMLAKHAEDRWPSFAEAIKHLAVGSSAPVRPPAPTPAAPAEAAGASDSPDVAATADEDAEAGVDAGVPAGTVAPPPGTRDPDVGPSLEDPDTAPAPTRSDPSSTPDAPSAPSRSRRRLAVIGTAAILVPLFLLGREVRRALAPDTPLDEFATTESSLDGSTDEGRSADGPAVAAVDVSPNAPSLAVGQEVTLLPTATDADGQRVPGAQVRFTSSDPSVATVTEGGLVRAAAPGTATISVAAGDQVATALVRVSRPTAPAPDRVASLWTASDSVALEVGLDATVRAEPRSADDRALSGRTIDWESADPSVAGVTGGSDGVTIRGAAAGTTRVFGRVDGIERSLAVVVAPEPVAAVLVDRPTLTLTAGESATLGATVRGVRTAALNRAPAWQSSDAAVARVSAGGVVVGVAPGTATITAGVGGRTATVPVTVNAAAPAASLGGLAAALELLGGGAGLVHRLTLTRVEAGAGPWCAVSMVAHGDDGTEPVRLAHGFEPQPGGIQEISVPAAFEAVGLDPGQYRATARRVSARVQVWGSACGGVPSGGGAPLATTEATICLSKLGSGGWRDRPNDCG